MERQKALSMDEAKVKLRNLKEHMPDLDGARARLLLPFAELLADYMNPELVPQGFVIACELLLHDVEAGVNGRTGEPIRSDLVGYPPVLYRLLRLEIPALAKAIFPEDFAKGVQEFVNGVMQQMKEKREAAKAV